MLYNLTKWITRFSQGRVVLVCLAIFLVFSIVVLPEQASKAEVFASEIGSPDTSFFYTAQDLYQFAEAYGPEGRTAYIQARFTFDVVWPLVYTIFLATAISWLIKRASPQKAQWQYLNLIPISGMLFDVLENISTSIVMASFPHSRLVFAHLAGVFTMVKWVLIGGSFVVLVIGVVLMIWHSLQKSIQK